MCRHKTTSPCRGEGGEPGSLRRNGSWKTSGDTRPDALERLGTRKVVWISAERHPINSGENRTKKGRRATRVKLRPLRGDTGCSSINKEGKKTDFEGGEGGAKGKRNPSALRTKGEGLGTVKPKRSKLHGFLALEASVGNEVRGQATFHRESVKNYRLLPRQNKTRKRR